MQKLKVVPMIHFSKEDTIPSMEPIGWNRTSDLAGSASKRGVNTSMEDHICCAYCNRPFPQKYLKLIKKKINHPNDKMPLNPLICPNCGELNALDSGVSMTWAMLCWIPIYGTVPVFALLSYAYEIHWISFNPVLFIAVPVLYMFAGLRVSAWYADKTKLPDFSLVKIEDSPIRDI